jgi:hypothetical protein
MGFQKQDMLKDYEWKDILLNMRRGESPEEKEKWLKFGIQCVLFLRRTLGNFEDKE